MPSDDLHWFILGMALVGCERFWTGEGTDNRYRDIEGNQDTGEVDENADI